MSLTIAIPAFNEQDSLKAIVIRAIKVAQALTKDYEILLVDDGSTDATGKIIDTFSKRNHHIKALHHAKNQGFSGAIKSCYRNASKNLVFLIPADGQVDPGDVKKFLKKIHDTDVVVGYRIASPESYVRKFNSLLFHLLYRIFFGVKLKEISTAVLWRKKALDTLPMTSAQRSAMIEPELIYRAWKKGYRIAEVGIPYYPRKYGRPKGADPLMILITLIELLKLLLTVRGKAALDYFRRKEQVTGKRYANL